MMMVVAEPGSRIRVARGALVVETKAGKKVVVESSVERVIISSSRVSISSAAVRAAAKMGIDLVFLDWDGSPVARLYPPIINKTVATRIGQFSANERLRRLIAAELVSAKIYNQGQTLKYIARQRADERLREAGYEVELLSGEPLRIADEDGPGFRDKLLSIEARASRRYWQCIAEILPGRLGFSGRDRGALDPFNAALNYGYGMLYSIVEKSLLLVGLDPYLGVFHSEKSGKPSLTLDAIEPFRAPIVDRILALKAGRMYLKLEAGRLDYKSRKEVAKAVASSLSMKAAVRGLGRRIRLEDAIMVQARWLAEAFRGSGGFSAVRLGL
ncbi:putative CRISPR-associated protein Cas1 [Aeropyrum pernix K1]|uniref:CRISPR-associated endonuclease Cas1 n=2 Tax=Aeropyrum pernix TaxID=56636 RepID=Q9YCL8_AERPE|nr:putative CRISPR-associated protein Cas1 [Aeropyrum pernix K1]